MMYPNPSLTHVVHPSLMPRIGVIVKLVFNHQENLELLNRKQN